MIKKLLDPYDKPKKLTKATLDPVTKEITESEA